MRRKWHTGQDEDKSGKTSTPPFPCAASASIPLGKDVHCTPVLKARPIQEGCRHVPPLRASRMTLTAWRKIHCWRFGACRRYPAVDFLTCCMCHRPYACASMRLLSDTVALQQAFWYGMEHIRQEVRFGRMTPEKVTALQCMSDG